MSELERARELRERVLRGDVVAGILSPGQANEMVELYTSAADPQGLMELADLYLSPLLRAEPDPERAIRIYGQALAAGAGVEAHAQRLCTAYFHAREALDTEELAADRAAIEARGDAQDLCLLAYCAYAGFGQPADPEASAALHQRAADAGSADSMFDLYVFHTQGVGVPADESVAMVWLQRAAEAGNIRAMSNLGGLYATGRGVPRDPEASVSWYTKAAKAGHGGAAATLTYMHLTGHGAPVDVELAKSFRGLGRSGGVDVDAFLADLGVDPAPLQS